MINAIEKSSGAAVMLAVRRRAVSLGPRTSGPLFGASGRDARGPGARRRSGADQDAPAGALWERARPFATSAATWRTSSESLFASALRSP